MPELYCGRCGTPIQNPAKHRRWHERRDAMTTPCAPCVNGDHLACIGVPPAGDWCPCVLQSDDHRPLRGEVCLAIGTEPTEDGPGADPEYDGGPGSRSTVDRWEWEQRLHEERTRG